LLSNLTLKWYNEGQNEQFYVFIDEFQKIKNIGTIIKGLYDTHKNIKFFLSWSSSILINKVFGDSMLGRKKTFFLDKLSFEEYLEFKWNKELLEVYNNINSVLNIDLYQKDFLLAFEEYLKFWWYPNVVLENTKDSKIKVLEEIYSSYLQKDIKDFFTLEHYNDIKRLFIYLTSINTNFLKINSISNDLWITNYNLKKYLSIIEWTYIIDNVKPYFTNNIKTITKTSEVFFTDTWFYNYILKNFTDLELRADKWKLIENIVYLEINKNKSLLTELYFFRDTKWLEVDLILKKENNTVPIEIKSWDYNKKTPLNLKNFMKNNSLYFWIIINKSRFELIEENWNKYLYLPYYLSWKVEGFIL
jgi:predicted AAA+ superfamily ATPase